MQDLVKLARVSNTICFYGGKGSGKSLAMAYFGYKAHKLFGIPIYANMPLTVDYTHVDTFATFTGMNNCIFIGDDFELWANSRLYFSKKSKTLMEIILNLGKRRVAPFMWSCKRPMNCDVQLRDVTDIWIECKMFLNGDPQTVEEWHELRKYINNCYVYMDVYDYKGNYDHSEVLTDLDRWILLYDTFYEIKDIEYKEQPSYRHD